MCESWYDPWTEYYQNFVGDKECVCTCGSPDVLSITLVEGIPSTCVQCLEDVLTAADDAEEFDKWCGMFPGADIDECVALYYFLDFEPNRSILQNAGMSTVIDPIPF